MIKKMGMIVLGVAVMGFCMAAMPQRNAEAGQVYHAIQHYYQGASGNTGIRNVTKSFQTDDDYGKAWVNMGKIKMGNAIAWVKMNCGDQDSKKRFVWPWKTVIGFVFN